MEMRVLTAENNLPAAVDHMNSNCSTPYMSAASSPRRPRPQLDFFFYSAPTSPRSYNHQSMFSDVYDDYSAEDIALLKHDHSAAVPFDWELKPGVAKSTGVSYSKEDNQQHEQVMEHEKEEFEFDFSGQLDMMVRPSLSSADELFDGGKIRPLKLKPPPSLQISNDSKISSENHSPRSPKSAMSKFKDALNVSPKHRRKGSDEDPFEAAIRSSKKWDSSAAATAATNDDDSVQDRGRGRGRVKSITTANTNMNKRGSNSSRKGISRSLSPLRVSEFALLHEQQLQEHQYSNENSNSNRFLGRGTNTSSKKWRLKDLFLFRSASEGHYKDTQSFSKRWSVRSSFTGSGSGSGSGSVSESGSVSKRRGQAASAHEMHYTTNKAVSEEMKKKTSLPYKHGLLACLGFSPILPQFSYTFPSSSSTTLS
ncbi:uncharacterized protein LOC110704969 [Chenopodium quinoa]|uniref:uncharacterized protein LOC110704969 n=1 Tax=Chenopodium quinoa TaxID=63459 RepID=UPI000B78F61B|nr:uncharacterized protein LOC110704969 [Chenopodium quinoa]